MIVSVVILKDVLVAIVQREFFTQNAHILQENESGVSNRIRRYFTHVCRMVNVIDNSVQAGDKNHEHEGL